MSNAASLAEPFHQRARTKIVATVGPACQEKEALAELVARGVDVFRMNMAHGSRTEHEQAIAAIRQVSAEAGRPLGILVDLAGPKIRLSQLHREPTECRADQLFRFIRGDQARADDRLVSNYELLVDELSAGNRVMLADGMVSMVVVEKDGDSALCRVTGPGEIRSRQGINLPDSSLSVPALTDVDRENAEWAAQAGVDFVGLSFVRSPVEVRQLKELLVSHGSAALVVAKIEKREAMEQLDEIVAATDCVMVARGDLGVEIDVAETPAAQKRIIAACTQHQRPVIVATQMLDSMQRSPRPTRAEVSDVANAILDGADACMLSGETAIGEHPREAVEMMNRVMLATENMLADAVPAGSSPAGDVHPITSAMVQAASQIARQVDARLVVIATRSGSTARIKAKQRAFVRTVGVSDCEATLRQMCLYWGIMPLAGAPVFDGPELRQFIERWGKAEGRLAAGDRIVFVAGTGVEQRAHNSVLVHEVE